MANPSMAVRNARAQVPHFRPMIDETIYEYLRRAKDIPNTTTNPGMITSQAVGSGTM